MTLNILGTGAEHYYATGGVVTNWRHVASTTADLSRPRFHVLVTNTKQILSAADLVVVVSGWIKKAKPVLDQRDWIVVVHRIHDLLYRIDSLLTFLSVFRTIRNDSVILHSNTALYFTTKMEDFDIDLEFEEKTHVIFTPCTFAELVRLHSIPDVFSCEQADFLSLRQCALQTQLKWWNAFLIGYMPALHTADSVRLFFDRAMNCNFGLKLLSSITDHVLIQFTPIGFNCVQLRVSQSQDDVMYYDFTDQIAVATKEQWVLLAQLLYNSTYRIGMGADTDVEIEQNMGMFPIDSWSWGSSESVTGTTTHLFGTISTLAVTPSDLEALPRKVAALYPELFAREDGGEPYELRIIGEKGASIFEPPFYLYPIRKRFVDVVTAMIALGLPTIVLRQICEEEEILACAIYPMQQERIITSVKKIFSQREAVTGIGINEQVVKSRRIQ